MENRTTRCGDNSRKDMTASQRALELRKFFEPFYNSTAVSCEKRGLKGTINSDGALDAFAETVLWRLRGVRTMVSLIDRTTQYFLAGASRNSGGYKDELSLDRAWFGSSNIPTPGGLCEHTLAIDCATDKYPCFVVNDLREDERFARLPVVDGSIMSYRFYAGTPITTDHGINIGSFFMFDDKPRPEGLTVEQRKFLFDAASNVMRHLETKREAAERRRVALMSKGIAKFLETTSHVTESDLEASEASISRKNSEVRKASKASFSDIPRLPHVEHGKPDGNAGEVKDDEETSQNPSAKVLDQIKLTLDRAADILRESLELITGGVVFLDTALGYRDVGSANAYFDINLDAGEAPEEAHITESKTLFGSTLDIPALISAGSTARGGISPGQVRSFNDQYQPAKILAISVSETAQWDPSTRAPDGKTLQGLIDVYPKGNVWYIDDEGYFSSIEQAENVCEGHITTPTGKRRSRTPFDLARQRAEADSLSRVFKNARQIIFLPLWDAGGNRWYAGCFAWSQSAVPVFAVDPEIAYLSAFTNSMMVEISRLEAMTANKMKSDFISSISHEFRSPLHGILASTEFLRDSELDSMQTEFISTIQNCGSTLLDTINHVLDYSKINSFEKKGRETGALSNELYQNTDVALLCEEIVYGMMAAKEFQGITESSSPYKLASHKHASDAQVHIILDFEQRDWNYRIQSGALRRIIMNIFGNANKYTDSGFIIVQLSVREIKKEDATGFTCQHVFVMRIIDSGRGMSTEYMERKLYTPFAQEDSFSPGIGLGLSIVWSIINQLGGMIHIRSELGKGTDVEVNLPLERAGSNNVCSEMAQLDTGSLEAQRCLEAVRNISAGKAVAIIRDKPTNTHEKSCVNPRWQCLEKYFSTWFGFNVVHSEDHLTSTNADVIVTDNDKENLGQNMKSQLSAGMIPRRALQIREGMTCVLDRRECSNKCNVESIWNPIGPYKLARAVLALFKDQPRIETTLHSTSPAVASENNELSSTSSSSPAISTPLSGMKQSASDISHRSTSEIDRVTELLAIRPVSEVIKMPEPPKIPASATATKPVASGSESGTAQALQDMQSTAIPQHISLELLSNTFTPGMISSEVQNETSLRILAVDDNILNLQLLHRYLIKRPNDIIVTARNGIEAVTAVRQAKVSFDIILMDLSMPDMDGFEATRLIRVFEKSLKHCEASEIEESAMKAAHIRSISDISVGDLEQNENLKSTETQAARPGEHDLPRYRHAYIVALTGLASRRDRDEAEESGFDDFLTKPISFNRIGELLDRLSTEKIKGRSKACELMIGN